jgi:hypothetical protein
VASDDLDGADSVGEAGLRDGNAGHNGDSTFSSPSSLPADAVAADGVGALSAGAGSEGVASGWAEPA